MQHVLIVDDEKTLTWSLEKALARDREIYQVTTVNSGEDALEQLGTKGFDVIVLDIRLPGINGLDLLLKVRKEMPHVKVIIMTAYGSSDIREKAIARGSFYYIEKPFDVEDLRSLILKALKREDGVGFNGSISGLQLPDLIQMNCLSQSTTALYVNKNNRKGVLYFEDGQIVHAAVGDVVGEDAVYTILSWSSGDFRFVGGERSPRHTINKNWEYLLIEGMRKSDEMSLELDKGDIESSELPPVDEQTRLLIKNISSLSDCQGMAIVNTDGEELYRKGDIAKYVDIAFATRFFLRISDFLPEGILSRMEKISFISKDRLVVVYPFRVYIVLLGFNKGVLPRKLEATIENIISRYQV